MSHADCLMAIAPVPEPPYPMHSER